MYGVYNWDIIAIALGVRGLRYFLENRKLLAGVFFGLAWGTKVYPGLFIFAVLRERGVEGSWHLILYCCNRPCTAVFHVSASTGVHRFR